MARQVLPWAGAVAGFAIGGVAGAQAGFALGSLIGNAVDPIEMQGRKLGDAPSQVAAEGGARAIVFGKGCIRSLCILERGGRRVVKQRDSSGGKGSGPTTVNDRALWTYAIGLGEAIPGGRPLRIWEQEKLVYDVTPGSAILAESAAFAEKFRFYDGSEDQLPDPAIEAIYSDPEDAPYYRGTAYLVFPQRDLTDFGEAVPVYRVEVAAVVSTYQPTTIIAVGETAANVHRLTYSSDGSNWTEASNHPSGTQWSIAAASNNRFLAYDQSAARFSDDFGTTWLNSTTSFSGAGIAQADVRNSVVLMANASGTIYRSADNGATFTNLFPAGVKPSVISFTSASTAVGYDTTAGANNFVVSRDAGLTWAVEGVSTLLSSGGIGSAGYAGGVLFGGSVAGSLPAVVFTSDGEDASPVTLPGSSGTNVVTVAVNATSPSAARWVVGTNAGELYWSDNAVTWVKSSATVASAVRRVVWNGEVFVAGGGFGGDGIILYSPTGRDDWVEAIQPLTRSVVDVAAQPPAPNSAVGDPVPLATIIAALHDRSGHTPADYSVVELSELTDGVVIEQTVTAAESINSIIGCHFADPSDYDGKIHYIKRGKPVVKTLTADDLIDEPEVAQRNNSIEYPLKAHFLAQRADLAYGSSKSTSSRYSPDAKVVGEVSYTSPETFSEPVEPAKIAVKLHKILWTEAEGERVWHVTDDHLDLVPTDTVGLSYRGELVRCRITQIEDDPGQRKLKMIRDRQSAYTATLTEIPNPVPPTPPQSSIVAPTVLAVMDLPALTDNADTLNYYVGMSGQNDQWIGAVLQQSLDAGASFGNIGNTTINAIMGTTLAAVSDASPYYTDGTNTAEVTLYMDDELESVTPTAFLSNGGAFALSWQDSGETRWELMQYRDAEHVSGNTWRLSHLLRGRKNTEAAAHPVGAVFVLIDTSILRQSAQTAWLGTDLTHRAVSNGLSPETAVPQTGEYVGHSQREWPVASLTLSRPDASTVAASVVPRHRFGSSMNPVRSINWEGYRWTATDGTNTINRDGLAASETFDTTGWASPVSVTVAQLNRLTGPGDAVTEDIA